MRLYTPSERTGTHAVQDQSANKSLRSRAMSISSGRVHLI